VTGRSYLYVPGDRPDMMAKAMSQGADALILDLEDAVPAAAKQDARDAVASFLRGRTDARPEIWVRMNGGDMLDDDVAAIAPARPDGLSLPKVSSPDDLARLDMLLGDAKTGVIALIETASGVLDAAAIARAPRVVRLAIGEADLAAELGIVPSDDARELAPMRAQVVLASAAARLDPPIGPVSTDFKDLDAFRRSTEALRRMGFGARAVIHPAQVAIVNESFTPSAEEVAEASKLVARFDATGGGVGVDDDGRMIDEAIVRAARRTLSLAGE
jgi:citrate lyase subunit beta/citryl-CoA lyase